MHLEHRIVLFVNVKGHIHIGTAKNSDDLPRLYLQRLNRLPRFDALAVIKQMKIGLLGNTCVGNLEGHHLRLG